MATQRQKEIHTGIMIQKFGSSLFVKSTLFLLIYQAIGPDNTVDAVHLKASRTNIFDHSKEVDTGFESQFSNHRRGVLRGVLKNAAGKNRKKGQKPGRASGNRGKGPKKDKKGAADVALLFVGHGEPRNLEAGYVPITLADGTPFGPHAAGLGVPPEFQYTEWAAAYEEIATAMTYIMLDANGNGIQHEMKMFPEGDVPPFFTWSDFCDGLKEQYEACGNYSPHIDALYEHVENLEIQVCGNKIDVYLAFLDAVPRIRDVVSDIVGSEKSYKKLAVVPMLLSESTHTQEVHTLVEESVHLTGDMEVVVVTKPFFEVAFMSRRLRDSVVAMAKHLRNAISMDVPDYNIGVVLESHGTPYVPARAEFGWQKGEIFSDLILTEDSFHDEISKRLPWESRTGRMKYSSPSVEHTIDTFDADGFTHVIVVPTGFPTAAIHTMWDVGNSAIGRAVLPEEGVVTHTRPSGMKVLYSAEGFADMEPGRSEFRKGLEFMGAAAVMEALLEDRPDNDVTSYVACHPGEMCVTVSLVGETKADVLRFVFYQLADEDSWPQEFEELPPPAWEMEHPVPKRVPARLRVSLGDIFFYKSMFEGARVGLVISSSSNTKMEYTNPIGFSSKTVVNMAEMGWDFGTIHLAPQRNMCLPGEICVTVTAQETTGPDIKMLLYLTDASGWPQDYLDIPTPTWVVIETTAVPSTFPIHIRAPILDNLYGFTDDKLVGARLGLAVVTGVASNFIVDPSDARGFSATTLLYETDGATLDFRDVELTISEGICQRNPYNPACLTGPLLWSEPRLLGDQNFVDGAIYMDFADLNQDGVKDLVMVGEPHFENPSLPLTVLKLGIYYLNSDLSVRETEIIDEWSENDQTFYSPWGVKVIDHGGEPMIIVGLNIPELAPLEEGNGNVLSYRRVNGLWQRSIIMNNEDPTVTNYNAMIVVTSDIDNDGDEDLVLSGAFQTSSIGSWMENTGNVDNPWNPHFQPMDPTTDSAIRGTLAYKSADLNDDGYPEIMYNAMFDIPGTNPPRYRGEIWLAINPGPNNNDDWEEPWQKVVIDNDNWASADMWFHDFDGDGYLDLIANQIFDSTVSLYRNPGGNLSDPWERRVIISGLASPSDMYLVDVDQDGLMDVVSADHTAHRGVWHKNPGFAESGLWQMNLIFPNVLLPGDFVMDDVDGDGDLDWIGTSVTLGQGFIVQQVHPPTSLVTTLSLPDDFDGIISSLMLSLVSRFPVSGPPDKTLALVSNEDKDGDGIGDVDQILSSSQDLVLAMKDVELSGDFYVMAVLYMQGGGRFQPLPNIDYMATSPMVTLGQDQVKVSLDLELYQSF